MSIDRDCLMSFKGGWKSITINRGFSVVAE